MGTAITNGNDVVSFLKSQHEQVKAQFGKVLAAQGEQRAKEFFALRRMMAIHETAEEEIVHPAARRALPDGDAIVDARLEEENKAKKVLAALEALEPNSTQFQTRLEALQKDVLAHAQAEEEQEFSRLTSCLDEKQLSRMRRAVEIAEAIAPTRPHAGIESAAGNLIAGPFASMIDRARDALGGKN